MHRGWFFLIGFVLGVTVLPAAAPAGPTQRMGGTLRLSFPADVDSLDPAMAYSPASWNLEFATCARLYSYPDKPAPAGVVAIPEVAKGFPKVSRDGRTQTIELKASYRFHTGARVAAANFVAAFNRDARREMQSSARAYLHEIVGADAVIDGRARTISGVTARGAYTLRIRTTRPLPDLVSRLTMPFFCPIATRTPLREISNPPGSGPYYVASSVPNRQIVLERNRFYRGPRPAHVGRIVISVGLGLEACRGKLELDQVDYCLRIPEGAYREIAAVHGVNRPNGRFFVNPKLATSYFAFNHDRPAFKGAGQIPLKQAINWAIDRPALARATGYLASKRTDQILPPAMGRKASIYPLGGVTEQSLAKARALLARARQRPDTLVLYTATVAQLPVQAQIFQFNLKRLGIEVDVKYFPLDEYRRRVGTRGEPFDVSIGVWTTDFPDGSGFFQLLSGRAITKSGNWNTAYFDRPKYNREIERIDRLTGDARRKAWADLDLEMMRNDPPWAPFENQAQRDFISRNFGCYLLHPVTGHVNLAAACKK